MQDCKNPIFLAQSDTTVGFLCADFTKLNALKKRESKKNVLLSVDNNVKLKELTRVPEIHKNRVRKAKKSTFIYKNNLAIRVIKDKKHSDFLQFLPFLYSTSANLHKQDFDEKFALESVDIIVLDDREMAQKEASKIFKLSNKNIKRIR